MEKYLNLKVHPSTKNLFVSIADRLGRKHVDLSRDMVDYFYSSGKDPGISETLTTSEELKKLKDTVISFVRRQEAKILVPMAKQVEDQSIALAGFLNDTGHLRLGNKGSAEVDEIVASAIEEDLKRANKQMAIIKHRMELVKKASSFEKGQVVLKMSEDEFKQAFDWL